MIGRFLVGDVADHRDPDAGRLQPARIMSVRLKLDLVGQRRRCRAQGRHRQPGRIGSHQPALRPRVVLDHRGQKSDRQFRGLEIVPQVNRFDTFDSFDSSATATTIVGWPGMAGIASCGGGISSAP